jgi:hypothetical protein
MVVWRNHHEHRQSDIAPRYYQEVIGVWGTT